MEDLYSNDEQPIITYDQWQEMVNKNNFSLKFTIPRPKNIAQTDDKQPIITYAQWQEMVNKSDVKFTIPRHLIKTEDETNMTVFQEIVNQKESSLKYRPPKGRPPNGMQWDKDIGIWVKKEKPIHPIYHLRPRPLHYP